MTEAERFLAKKLQRSEAPAGQPAAVAPSKAGPCESADRGPDGPPPTAQAPKAGGKGWQVGMAVFAVLMTMFWMAMCKGGCR